MTATLTPIDNGSSVDVDESAIVDEPRILDDLDTTGQVATDIADEIGFGRTQLVSLTIGIVGVWTLATVAMGSYLDNYGAGAALGAYLAFWIGGGTGFMAGGIRWGLAQEEH